MSGFLRQLSEAGWGQSDFKRQARCPTAEGCEAQGDESREPAGLELDLLVGPKLIGEAPRV